MTAIENPILDREAILQSFLADAEADTQAVVSVTELMGRCESLQEQLVAARGQFAAAYAAATRRPTVAAKLRELGVQAPAALKGAPVRKRPASRPSGNRRVPSVSAPTKSTQAADTEKGSSGEHTA